VYRKVALLVMVGVAVTLAAATVSMLAVPAYAEHAECKPWNEEGCHGWPPQGAAPFWEELCVTEWQWDEQYQGWWAYDGSGAMPYCSPEGTWHWYGATGHK